MAIAEDTAIAILKHNTNTFPLTRSPPLPTHTEQRWYENVSVLPSQYPYIIALTH
jgi:hypothetical protein